MEPIEALEKIGLTKNESIVYLALLKLGTSKTGEILKRSNLNSGKIYEILESLKTKGLASESIINNVKHFNSASPSQILEYIYKKKEELKSEEEEIRKMIPMISSLEAMPFKGLKAVTYTGLRGIKTAAEEALESLKPGEEILAMGVTELKDKRFNEFWKDWQKKRVAKKINQFMLFSEKSNYYKEFSKSPHTKTRALTGITPATIDIFGEDKVLILNYQDSGSCILVYDKNTATSFKQFFKQLWKIAKK